MTHPDLTIIGGGLAGTEAAWQAAERGLCVRIYEMRPAKSTGAHRTSDLAELVCSNSLGSNLADRASGLLKNELRLLGSLLVQCAQLTALPAGTALAVDRGAFSRLVSERLASHPNIEIVRSEITEIPDVPTIIASGPLTSGGLSHSIARLTGENQLFFFDAIAPIVTFKSIDTKIAFRASRYGTGNAEDGDYINCPLNKEEYESFVQELLSAKRINLREFETKIEQGVIAGSPKFFEGCLPVEIIARRGNQALAFGPMRPTGLVDPHTGRWPHALLQLRQDNLLGSLYNLVGFQTNLTFPEQKRIFRLIPGLGNAEFIRFGQMHRNTFIASPKILLPTLQYRKRADLFFAGQITGVEGYMGNIATGLLAGINAANIMRGRKPIFLPETTMLGALCYYIVHANMKDYQPMKANFGILPPLATNNRIDRRERARLFVERAQTDLISYFKGKHDIIMTMRKSQFFILIAFGVLFIMLIGWRLSVLTLNPIQFSGQRAYRDVLAQVGYGPRIPNSQAHAKTMAYIQDELHNAGWKAEIQKSSWGSYDVSNIIAMRNDRPPKIILGAHYDSRLLADQAPRLGRLASVPGANDGASGVAVLLELARTIPLDSTPTWLVFFDSEDNGGLDGRDWIMGSRAFVSTLAFSPRAAIIVDMVGDVDLNIHIERNSDTTLVSEIWGQAAKLGYGRQFVQTAKYSIVDDHIPFLEAGIPAVDIIDFDYPFWHTSADTTDKVSAKSLEIVGKTLLAWMATQR